MMSVLVIATLLFFKNIQKVIQGMLELISATGNLSEPHPSSSLFCTACHLRIFFGAFSIESGKCKIVLAFLLPVGMKRRNNSSTPICDNRLSDATFQYMTA